MRGEFGSRLCLLVPGNRTRDHRQKLMYGKFYLNIRTNVFMARLISQWNRLSGVAAFSSPEMNPRTIWTQPSAVCLGTALLEQGPGVVPH